VIGQTIAHYEITALLGRGGMGEVYRAHDTKLGRDVALKFLPEAMARDAARLARFQQEARTVASLNHPNIVTLFSVEEAGGTRFLTMELVDGQGLDHHVVPDGLPVERVIELGTRIADALATAHDKGIVHRDLKPANVMLSAGGTLKVLDFGLAKLDPSDTGRSEATDETVAVGVTAEDQVVGTIPYMAPEQVRGQEVDPRTDLFALGVLLYELATGRRPFQGDTPGVVSSSILRDEPVLVGAIRADAPPDLERIIARCLEKDPGDRYQTARDVSSELRFVGKGRRGERILISPPTPSTPLLGRDATIEEAITRLEQGARVLTVSGYGGTGKTRFSIELFRRRAPEYDGGAAFVSLASVTDPAEVLPTVASTLDIAEAHGRSALEAIATVIGHRPFLLVLDNLEQVLDAATDIAELVARCDALQVIATSRAPLKIGAESEFPLPPLELPDEAEHSPDRLQACPSVALFVQRAVRVKPDFRLDASNADAVSGICRQLDGLPLALELAAARVRIMEPSKLLLRLDHALDLLSSGDRDLPLRQRTLRATISWSYSLLDDTEQRLLRRCSVFHEGWTFEAMEQVCYADDDRWRALDELESLVEKGLVRVIGGGDRYALLETIRAFSAEQLHATGETEQLRDRHARFFTEWMAGMYEEFRDERQVPAMGRFRADIANELAAIHWLLARAREGDIGALESVLLLCGRLNWFWHVSGMHNTARGLYDEALAMARENEPSPGRGLALLGAGMVSITTGEWDRALEEWTAAHRDGIALGDDAIASEGAMGMGYVHLNSGRLAEAREPLERSIELGAGGVCPFVESLSMSCKGMLLFQEGDLDEGVRLVEQALQAQQRRKDCEVGGISLSFLASMSFARGDLDRAREFYVESERTFEEVGDRPEVARVQCEAGWTALAADDPAAAGATFRRALLTYEEVGSPRGTGLAMLGLAAVEAAEGRPERAVAIGSAAQALTERAGVVCDHPMDPGVVDRIEELKSAIPAATVGGLLAGASELTPADVLAILSDNRAA